MVWYRTMAFPSQQASRGRTTSAECGGIEAKTRDHGTGGKG